MNYIDFVILGFLLIGFILGYKDGFIRKIIGLAGLALAFILAFKYSGWAAVELAPYLGNEMEFAKILSGIFIFAAVILIFSVVKRLVHPIDRVNKFLNQLLGGITGILQTLFFVSAFLIVLNLFNVPAQAARSGSMFYEKAYSVIPYTVNLFFDIETNPEEIIKRSIESEEVSLDSVYSKDE